MPKEAEKLVIIEYLDYKTGKHFHVLKWVARSENPDSVEFLFNLTHGEDAQFISLEEITV